MKSTFYEWHNANLLLRIKVQPRASKDEFCEVMGDRLKVRITAPPVDGKANQHLIKYLSRQFQVSRSRVSLVSGENHREKRFRISAPGKLPDFISPPAA
ncbi:COG1872 [hydrothermal vent metagenome]|uniref:COG1872 n=1 Tax=hydrothermal vent metagenome TaxID=652676 RepID=A0A3B0XP57_9ZZZZ